jgi:hypothetical protein
MARLTQLLVRCAHRRSRLALRAASVALYLLALAPGPAGAQQPASASDEADRLFREGREAMKRGDAVAACPKFAESQKLDPAPGTLINLSECEEQLGRLTDAWRHIQQAAQQLAPDDDRLPIAREQAESLDRRIPRLTVRLKPGAPAASRILLDNTEPLIAGTTVVIDPGSHVISVAAAGHRTSLTAVRVAERQRVELVLAPEPLAPAASPPSSTHRTLAWVAAGVGAAGLATAGVTALVLNGKQSTVDAHCDPNRVCDQLGYDAARSGRRLEPLYLGAWLVGGAGAAAALVLFSTAPGSEPAAVRVSAGAVPGGTGLSVSGGFW